MSETVALTLTDFLLARIAEDEAAVNAARGLQDYMPDGAWDLDRVLAECEAKRRIVEGMQPYGALDDMFAPEILGLLALPYADHPDYRKEWRF